MSTIVLKGSATDLTVLEQLTPADLFAPQGTEPVFEAISKEVASFVPDMTTEAGRKEIASMAYKIAQSKNFLDKVGKIFNADLKEKTKAVDAERKAIWDKLEALQKQVRAPLDEFEAKEELRVQGHKDAMAEIEALPNFSSPPTVEQVQTALARGRELCGRDWEEFSEIALEVSGNVAEKLGGMLAVAEQAERDRAELEALRKAKAVRDAEDAEEYRQQAAAAEKARIEKEAAEKAQRDAEAAIKAAQDAAEAERQKAIQAQAESERRLKAAEEARIAAEAKAKLEADAAVQREKDRAAAEQKRLDDEAKARENNRAHHAKINNEVATAIKRVLDSATNDDMEMLIVTAIAKGEIPHTKISY